MSVNYNFNYNWSQPANMPNKLDAHDAAFYKNMSMTNDGLAPAYTDDELELFRNGSDPRRYPNTDWQKTLFEELRTGNATYPDCHRW